MIPKIPIFSVSQSSFQSVHSLKQTKINKWNFGKVIFSDIQLIRQVVPFNCIAIIWDEPETTQAQKVPSETPLLGKTLNSKCHNNVEAKSKVARKN